MVFHRHHHGPLHAVRNVGWSGDEQKISTWHAGSHHALLCGNKTALLSRARPFHPSERPHDATHTICPGPEGPSLREEQARGDMQQPKTSRRSQRFALVFTLSQFLRARAR